MILMIDNYDSFTYNLVQYFGELGADMKVVRNDVLNVDDVKKMKPKKLSFLLVQVGQKAREYPLM